MYCKSLKTKKDVLTLKNLQAEEKPISNCSQKGAYIRLTQAQHEFIPYASRPFCSHNFLLTVSFLGLLCAPQNAPI